MISRSFAGISVGTESIDRNNQHSRFLNKVQRSIRTIRGVLLVLFKGYIIHVLTKLSCYHRVFKDPGLCVLRHVCNLKVQGRSRKVKAGAAMVAAVKMSDWDQD